MNWFLSVSCYDLFRVVTQQLGAAVGLACHGNQTPTRSNGRMAFSFLSQAATMQPQPPTSPPLFGSLQIVSVCNACNKLFFSLAIIQPKVRNTFHPRRFLPITRSHSHIPTLKYSVINHSLPFWGINQHLKALLAHNELSRIG